MPGGLLASVDADLTDEEVEAARIALESLRGAAGPVAFEWLTRIMDEHTALKKECQYLRQWEPPL